MSKLDTLQLEAPWRGLVTAGVPLGSHPRQRLSYVEFSTCPRPTPTSPAALPGILHGRPDVVSLHQVVQAGHLVAVRSSILPLNQIISRS